MEIQSLLQEVDSQLHNIDSDIQLIYKILDDEPHPEDSQESDESPPLKNFTAYTVNQTGDVISDTRPLKQALAYQVTGPSEELREESESSATRQSFVSYTQKASELGSLDDTQDTSSQSPDSEALHLEALKQLRERQQVFKEHVQEQETSLRSDEVFTQLGSGQGGLDEYYSQLHPGEFEDYSARAPELLLGNDDVVGATLRSDSGDVVTHVKTHQLTPEEQQERSVKFDIEGGLMRRSDGRVMDTTDSRAMLSSTGSFEGTEMWVVTEEGDLRAGAQKEMTQGLVEYHIAQKRLLAATGRKTPVDLEEARAYGFPEEVLMGHHTSLSGGETIKAGGELRVEQGKLAELSNTSGHYQPDAESTFKVLELLDDAGVVVRSTEGTRIVVLNELGEKETFEASEVLAARGSLALARKLKEERLRRASDSEAIPDSLTPEQQSLLRQHRERIAERQREAGQALSQRRKKLEGRLQRLTDAFYRLASDTPEEERLSWERRLDDTEEKLQETTSMLARALKEIQGLLEAQEKALRSAGIDPEVLADILRNQRVGLGHLSEAELELRVWTSSVADRRKDLRELARLAQDPDVQARRKEARERLQQNLGG